jgi:hypothetical protein
MTDLELLKDTFDKLGVEYHELVEDGYTFIQKYKAHEKPGFIMVMFEHVPLKSSSQLDNYYEFTPEGDIASW